MSPAVTDDATCNYSIMADRLKPISQLRFDYDTIVYDMTIPGRIRLRRYRRIVVESQLYNHGLVSLLSSSSPLSPLQSSPLSPLVFHLT